MIRKAEKKDLFSLSGQRRLEAGTTEYVIKMLAIE